MPKKIRAKYVVSNSISARKNADELLKKIDASPAQSKKDGTAKAIFAKYGVDRTVAK